MILRSHRSKMVKSLQKVLLITLQRYTCFPIFYPTQTPLLFRFGHINYKYLSNLSEKHMVIGLPKIKFFKGVCQGCILGKHPEHKFERASHERTFAPLELIHSDVAGPFPHMSMIQPKYALNFIDDFSRYCWVHFLKHKYEVLTSSKYLKPLEENQDSRI